jgi:hypothetical protein
MRWTLRDMDDQKFPHVDGKERASVIAVWMGMALFFGVPWFTGIATLIRALLNAF